MDIEDLEDLAPLPGSSSTAGGVPGEDGYSDPGRRPLPGARGGVVRHARPAAQALARGAQAGDRGSGADGGEAEAATAGGSGCGTAGGAASSSTAFLPGKATIWVKTFGCDAKQGGAQFHFSCDAYNGLMALRGP